jgi:phosphohistidine swiveling domain-containing protein
MAWQLMVIRKDSPLRHQLAAAGNNDAADKCNIVDSPALAGLRTDRYWFDSDGSCHGHMGQLRALMGGLIKTYHQHPTFLLDLSKRYRGVAQQWLATMDKIAATDLKALSNSELLQRFDDFCAGAIASNNMLLPPFAVERMQAGDEYQALLARLADELANKVTEEVRAGNGSFNAFYLAHIADKLSKQELINRVKGIIEFSSERTFTEQKQLALLGVAAGFQEKRPELATWLLQHVGAPSREEMIAKWPDAVKEIDSVLKTFEWIKQWGYPPFYGPFTFTDFVTEITDMLRADAIGTYRDELVEQRLAEVRFDAFRKHIKIGNGELALINTINEYNFLRTWRMEVVMRCQYLSMPLLREIEGRAIREGKMQRDDIFLLMAPEIRQYLLEGAIPEGMSERRDGWVMWTHEGVAEIAVGDVARRERTSFYSVLDWTEKARSKYGHDAATVGGKAENLFALLDMKQQVPKFFVVTTEAYKAFLAANGLTDKLARVLRQHSVAPRGETAAINAVEHDVHSLFLQGKIPEEVAKAVTSQANELGLTNMAVRSSASVEDAPGLSWAGRFQSFGYVAPVDLLTRIKEVWASLYGSVALQYALEHGLDPLQLEMAVIVQEMLDPTASGVINTSWSLKVKDVMEIEAVWGQCAPLVSGQITPDTYLVRKNDGMDITDKTIANQQVRAGSAGLVPVPAEQRGVQKLPDEMIKRLAAIAMSVEKSLERPQDIEWAQVGNDLFLVQTRPLTGAGGEALPTDDASGTDSDLDFELVLTGQKGKVSASVVAEAFVAETLEDAARLTPGQIIVLAAATPNWDPMLVRACAIITNEGGATSHAVRVANERNLPAVVGTGKATKTIRTGDRLRVDTTEPFRGKVYRVLGKASSKV